MAESQNHESPGLPPPNRFITDHNTDGLSIFHTGIPDRLPAQVMGNMAYHLGYATASSPVSFTNRSDISTYSSFLSTPPGIVISGGSVMRIVDIGPGGDTPMHRTASLDYGVVLEGEIELVLDSGESRTLKRGDILVQRGTDHRWRNRSQTEWGRMLFVTQEAKLVEINGKVAGEGETAGLESFHLSGS